MIMGNWWSEQPHPHDHDRGDRRSWKYRLWDTATFTNQKIPGSACGISATANFSGTYKTSTNVSDSS
jgi:hypothetical protein